LVTHTAGSWIEEFTPILEKADETVSFSFLHTFSSAGIMLVYWIRLSCNHWSLSEWKKIELPMSAGESDLRADQFFNWG
jgi:hypothetical protein